MRVVVVTGTARSLVSFRGHLIRAMVDAGHQVLALSSDDNPGIRDEIHQLGAEWRPIPILQGSANPGADVRLFRALRAELSESSADVVVGFTVKAAIWGAAAAASLGLRSFAVITGLGHLFLDKTAIGRFRLALSWPLLKFALSRCDRVFVQNPDDGDELVRLRLAAPNDILELAGSGVELSLYPRSALPAGPVSFLFVGRLIREKGIAELFDAVRILRSEGLKPSVVVAGAADRNDGTFAADLQQQAEILGIEMLGRVPDVRPIMAAAHVLVLPSYREGTPRSCLEAMCVGRPLIVTDVPGCRNVVREGVNGTLVAARDARALADSLKEFMEVPLERLADMGNASRQLVEERFDVNFVTRDLMEGMQLSGAPGFGGGSFP